MSPQSTAISGAIPIELPLQVQGPPVETWKDLTRQTLALTNQVDDLDDLIDLESYNAAEYDSVGNYFRKVAWDFIARGNPLRRATEKTQGDHRLAESIPVPRSAVKPHVEFTLWPARCERPPASDSKERRGALVG